MSRYRWFQSKWAYDLRYIAGEMLKLAYNESSAYGYRLEKARDSVILGRYIERRDYEDMIEGPSGDIISVDRFDFDITKFAIDDTEIGLQIVNPPRKLSSFFISLSNVNDNKAIIKPIIVKLDRWIEELQIVFSELVVVHLCCSGLSLSSKTSAKIVLSGSEDVRNHAHSLTRGTPVQLEHARIQFRVENAMCVADLTRNGCVKVNMPHASFAISTFKNALARAITMPDDAK